MTSLSEEPRLWVIHTGRSSGKGPEKVMPWLFGLKGRQPSHNLTKLRTKGRSLANTFWPLGNCRSRLLLRLSSFGHSVRPSVPSRLPRGVHGGRNATQARFGQTPRGEALGRPSVVGAQKPSATRPARPGWVNPSTPHVDVCYACFGIGHRRPQCPHKDRPRMTRTVRGARTENLSPAADTARRRVAQSGHCALRSRRQVADEA